MFLFYKSYDITGNFYHSHLGVIFFNNKSISGEICNFKGPPCKWVDGWQSLTVLCIPQNAYIQPLESFKHFWTFIDPLKPFGHARTLTYLDSPQLLFTNLGQSLMLKNSKEKRLNMDNHTHTLHENFPSWAAHYN